MVLHNKLNVTAHANDTMTLACDNNVITIDTFHPIYRAMSDLYNALRSVGYKNRPEQFEQMVKDGTCPAEIIDWCMSNMWDGVSPFDTDNPSVPVVEQSAEEKLKATLQKMMDFFSEFCFAPSFRFVNTLSRLLTKNITAGSNYVMNYFNLMDYSYKSEIADKIKSAEFKDILKALKDYGKPATPINNRLRIYFGSAGTGKTTIALTEADNRNIVCNASMLPSDLMEDFVFTDGKPDFNPSILWKCMEEGKTIVLDEINLLPFDALRFLQGVCDGKKEFIYKNRVVHINDGFQIIGTMNLALGGMVYGLPEPLVDRCEEIREFTLTAEQLMKSITD